jgi:hypothetical protein
MEEELGKLKGNRATRSEAGHLVPVMMASGNPQRWGSPENTPEQEVCSSASVWLCLLLWTLMPCLSSDPLDFLASQLGLGALTVAEGAMGSQGLTGWTPGPRERELGQGRDQSQQWRGKGPQGQASRH